MNIDTRSQAFKGWHGFYILVGVMGGCVYALCLVGLNARVISYFDGVMVPLDENGLTGNLTDDTHFPETDWRARYFGPENLHQSVVRANALNDLLLKDMSLPDMALRFILANQIVSTTIVGMRSLDHLHEDVRVSDGVGLPDELITQLRLHRWDR